MNYFYYWLLELKGVVVGSDGVSDAGGPTIQEFKCLAQQNERMKQALVKLRDLANQDKQQINSLNKEVSIFVLYLSCLIKCNDKISNTVIS